jgi:divalent metal cation (Fe/Co/Zn/Cd) transporter
MKKTLIVFILVIGSVLLTACAAATTGGSIPYATIPAGKAYADGKEIFFWSFVVALILFSMGGLFSVYEGIHKISTHEGLNRPLVAIVVLGLSMILEASSLYGCVTQINKIRHKESFWSWFKNSRKSELIVVLGEDVAALLGLTFAFISIILSER